jgi:hypothetical protein
VKSQNIKTTGKVVVEMERLTGSYSTQDWAELTKDWGLTLYVVSQITKEPLDMPSVTLLDCSPKESGWSVAEYEKIPLEPIFMDADRQKLELDITKEFEFADAEATQLIDESG